MECPFPIEMADNDDDDDPEVDKDEEQMREKKTSNITPIEDFSVTKKGPHMSEFDEDLRRKREQEEEDERIRGVTIDDDAPDYEKEDEFG